MNKPAQADGRKQRREDSASGTREVLAVVASEWLAHLRASIASHHESAHSLDERTLKDIGLHRIGGALHAVR